MSGGRDRLRLASGPMKIRILAAKTRILAALAATALVPAGLLTAAPAAGATASAPAPVRALSWQERPTGIDSRLRGLSAVSGSVAWVSGSGGAVLRTVDGGATWADVSPPGVEELEFRDIEAFGSRRAVVLAIGEGTDSRVYSTSDGGASWQLSYVNDEPRAFYDCLTFLDRRHGLALSDPVDGRFRILATSDGGATWQVRPSAGMPPALAGEFAFAASGTCLVGGPGGRAWFATGGGARARVFRSDDAGRTWEATSTPVASGPTAGIYSLAFRDRWHGIAVGGDFNLPDQATDAAAVTSDGGRTWTLVPDAHALGGYRSGAAWVSAMTPLALAVGPTGTDLSLTGGRSWQAFDDGSYDSVDCTPWGACWASGEKGRVARLRFS